MDPTQEGTRAPPNPQPSAQDPSSLAPSEESVQDLPAPSMLPATLPHFPPYYPYDFSQPIVHPVASEDTMGAPVDPLGAPWPAFPSFSYTNPLTEPQWSLSLPPLLPPPTQRLGLTGPWISRLASSGSSTTAPDDSQRRVVRVSSSLRTPSHAVQVPTDAMFATSPPRPLYPQYLAQGQALDDANQLPQSQVPLFSAYQARRNFLAHQN